jgi:Activator of Hsp90 ATPase homolog 1-like protein
VTEQFVTEVDLPAPPGEVFRHLTDPVAMIRWMGQHAVLKPVPGGAFEIEFTLTPVPGGTRLRLVHRGLPSGQDHVHAAGWQHFLARLTRAAAGENPGPDPWDQDPAPSP